MQNTTASTQLTVPESRSYVWHRLVFISYKRAFRIAKTIHHAQTQEELNDFLGELMLRKPPPKLNGERLMQLLIAAARNTGWFKRPVNTSGLTRQHAFLTGDPHTRCCIKCGQVNPLNAFIVPVSDRQAINWGVAQKREVAGFTDIYGRWQRGHTRNGALRKRTTISFKCAACRKEPRRKRTLGEVKLFKAAAAEERVKRTAMEQDQILQPEAEEARKAGRDAILRAIQQARMPRQPVAGNQRGETQ